MRILHVSEAWGGGVESAILDYTACLPLAEHILLVTPRDGYDTGDSVAAPNRRVVPLPKAPHLAIREVRRQLDMLRPDIVHAHSSFAGLYARLAVRRRSTPVVYTPHCYAFERRDVSRPARALYRLVERCLAPRTSVVAGVSRREVELARRLSARTPGVHVPNVARAATSVPLEQREKRFTVVGVGRLLPQKGALFFADVAKAVTDRDSGTTFLWIGDGSPSVVERLRASGVDVLGWSPRSVVLGHMSCSHVYLHTAVWEGAPLTVLEAAAAGTPVVARRILAMEELVEVDLADSVASCADKVLALRDRERWLAAQQRCRDLTARYSPAVQAERLMQAYTTASGPGSVPAGAAGHGQT